MKADRNKNERGMVLLIVLLVVALLVTILVEFAFSTLVDLRLAETYRDTTRAHYLAKGGITVGRTILQEDGDTNDNLDETWAQGIESYPVADGTVSIRIEDEGGKLDLNKLVDSSGSASDAFKNRFIKLLELLDAEDPDALADTLIDWIDPDDESRGVDAESSYYRSLPEPYNCKNGKLDSIPELALVRGYDKGVVDRLAPHVTAHGAEKDELNINTATAEVIQAWNYASDVPDAGRMIVEARMRTPFSATSQIKDIDPELATYDTTGYVFQSDFYRIESTAFVNDGRRTIRANVKKNGDILYKRVY